MDFRLHASAAATGQTSQIAAQRAEIRHCTRSACDGLAVTNMGIGQNDGATEMALTQQ
ncbi:hypothetical protein D3C87_1762140 [compost metagenome]